MATTFTPEQIAQILEEFFNTVGTRQYVGARYVPIFGRKDEESIEWDNTEPYEPLTIVLYQGNSYTSRQYVPVGVDITNQQFWANTGNYNAQVEQYRRDVLAVQQGLETERAAREAADTAEATARANADTALGNRITEEETARANADTALGNRITEEETARANADTQLSGRIQVTETILTALNRTELVVFGDSWADPTVEDSIWSSIVGTLTGLNVHNYAKNGAHQAGAATNLQAQAQTFLADTSFDKSKIKAVILVYGVNDQWTYPVDATACGDSIYNLCVSIDSSLPVNCPIIHFFDFTYGFQSNSPVKQAEYYARVSTYVKNRVNRYSSKWLYPYFSVYDMNTTNYFHLTQAGQRRGLVHVILNALDGHVCEEIAQYRGVLSRTELPGISIELDCASTRRNTVVSGLIHIESADNFVVKPTFDRVGTILPFPMRILCARIPLLANDGYTQIITRSNQSPSAQVDALVNQFSCAWAWGPEANFAAYPADVPFQITYPHVLAN